MDQDPPPEAEDTADQTAVDAGLDPAASEAEPATAPDIPPDRLAIDPRSPFFGGDSLQRGIGIRFKGARRTNVDEYCISQGWIRVQAGKSRDRRGQPLTLKLSGAVEAWFEDLGDGAPIAGKPDAV